jgi:hypothetical protein
VTAREASAPSPPNLFGVRAVADAFSRALGGVAVGDRDHFCRLGGDEAAAARLAAEVQEGAGTAVEAWRVFDHPTPTQYTAFVNRLVQSDPVLRPVPGGSSGGVPLGPAQERFLLVERALGRAMFNSVQRIDVTGDSPAEALAAAALDVVRRHEALRLNVSACGATLLQRAVDIAPVVQWHRTQLVQLDAVVNSLTTARTEELFDFTRDPPIRIDVVAAGPRRAALLLTTHHLSVDGRSMAVLRRDLAVAYRNLVSGSAFCQKAALQITDVMRWQHTRTAEHRDRHLAYWRSICSTGGSHPAPRRSSETIRFELPHRGLSVAASRAEATPRGLMFACYLMALRQSGIARSDPLAAFVQLDNREWADTADVVATLSNMLPVADSSARLGRLDDTVPAAMNALLAAFPHQEFPAETAMAALGAARLPRYGFTMLEPETEPIPVPGGTLIARPLSPSGRTSGPSAFDLVLEVRPAPSRLDCWLTYGLQSPGRTRAAALVDTFSSLLGQVTAETMASPDGRS